MVPSGQRPSINGSSYYYYFKGKIFIKHKEAQMTYGLGSIEHTARFFPSVFPCGSIQSFLSFSFTANTEGQHGLALSLGPLFHQGSHSFPVPSNTTKSLLVGRGSLMFSDPLLYNKTYLGIYCMRDLANK